MSRGLLLRAPLTTALPTSKLGTAFRIGGTASPADAEVSLRSDGLHVDVGAHAPGTWRGYYAATSATFPAGAVVHVRMSRPDGVVSGESESGITLLAVQTGASPLLDYVLVANVASGGHDSWIVGYANGGTAYSTTKVLTTVPSASATQDVTLSTDGRSHYEVYFGSRLVYSSDSLDLGVAPPLRVYLEVEARGIAYATRFQDLSVTRSDSVSVVGLHPGAPVTLAAEGRTAVSAVADASGRAEIHLPPDESAGTGTVTVGGPGGSQRFGSVDFAGGDRFAVRS